MRKLLVSLMVLSLVPALAGAAVTNPDGFEGYALTTQWSPTVIGEGWAFDEEGHELTDGNSVEIVDGSLAGNTTQVLKINSSVNLANVQGFWSANVPDAAVPVTEYGVEFTATEIGFGSEFRLGFLRESAAGEVSSLVVVGYGSWWGGGPGLPWAELYGADYDEEGARTWDREQILGLNGEFDPDGTPTFEPANGV